MRYTAAREAHGRGLVAVVDGVPAGLRIKTENIGADLARYDRLHGRPSQRPSYGGIDLVSGVRDGRTLGSAIVLCLDAADGADGADVSAAPVRDRRAVPYPSTAELSGSLKHDLDDCSDIAGCSEARMGAACVAAACAAREFLADLGVEIHSYVTRIGDASMREEAAAAERLAYTPLDIETSSLRCPSAQATRAMEAQIDEAVAAGDTLSGAFRLVITGVLPGIGDYAVPRGHLRARLAAAVFGIEGICGLRFGSAGVMRGAAALDAITCEGSLGFSRATNRAGGIEGGVASGAPIVMSIEASPAPYLGKSVAALDMETLAKAQAAPDAYDACRVPSLAVLAESEAAFELAQAYIEKFGGDCMGDVHEAVRAYRRRLARAAR